MNPLLALAAFRSVGALVANLAAGPANAAPPGPVFPGKAPRAFGPIVSRSAGAARFEDALRARTKEGNESRPALRFAEEVSQKMAERGIRLTEAQFEKLVEAVEEAAAKGGRTMLVLMNGLEFVVDVEARMVVDVSQRTGQGAAAHPGVDIVVEKNA
ncbi:MAG: hypothetical protein V3V62_01585 [bacterium]